MAERQFNTPNNSFAAKNLPATTAQPENNRPRATKTVVGATLKEPTKLEKVKDDMLKTGASVFDNTIKPSIKSMIFQAIMSGLSMIMFKDGKAPANTKFSGGRVDYGSRYNSGGNFSNPKPETRRSVKDAAFRNPVFLSIADANDAINEMRDILKNYPFVTWADLYDICGMDSNNWQGTNKYGWVTVDSATVNQFYNSDGEIRYELVMPKAMPIDDLEQEPPF